MAISVDDAARSKAYAARLGLDFPLLSDPERRVVRAYGVEDAENEIAWPAIYVVGRDGTVRWRSLAEVYKVRPAVEVVLEAIDAR